MDYEDEEEEYNNYIQSYWLMGGLAFAVSLATVILYNALFRIKDTPQNKFISPSRIEAKAIDIDPLNEGLEQMLTINGQQYTLQERNREPILVKYKKKD